MPFADVRDGVLHYRLGGPEGRPLLVLSNSLGTDLRIWDEVVRRLGAAFRILRYDKRGHGLSFATPAPYAIADHVADLEGLLDRLGLGPGIFCGLSVGGLIVQGLTARSPRRVRAIVLADTAARIGDAASWNARIAAVEAGGCAAVAEAVMERWFSPAFRAERPVDLVGWRTMLERTTVSGYAGTCAALRDADLTADLARIDVPALVLCGSRDLATPPDLVEATARAIPGASFRVIDGVGHLPCIEAPEVFADAVLTFCRENGLV